MSSVDEQKFWFGIIFVGSLMLIASALCVAEWLSDRRDEQRKRK